MAKRPVFIPNLEKPSPLVLVKEVEFTWYAGFSIQQKRKSIAALHQSARRRGISPVLEISTKSENPFGRKLSAFNLQIRVAEDRSVPVEAAFQSSKVFKDGSQYHDLLWKSGREIKKDERLKESGALIRFEFNGKPWPLEPKTAFYDWLYLHALQQNPDLSEKLLVYRGFTDIEFNPAKSINCQARSAALYVALNHHGLLQEAMEEKGKFLELLSSSSPQAKLPGMS